MHKIKSILYCLAILSIASGAYADEEAIEERASTENQFYRSPEERREAGAGYSITDWLRVSTLLEIEYEEFDFKLSPSEFNFKEDSTVATAQLGFEIAFSDSIQAEVIFEAERENRTSAILDEAVLIWELENWEWEAGRLSMPFGEYYSHFVIGPMLEFSETKAHGLISNYQLNDNLEISAFTFDDDVGAGHAGSTNWGGRIEYVNSNESIKLGVGYLSDLAESDEQLLQDSEDQDQVKVAAANIYLLLGFSEFEITTEHTAALDSFTDFDTHEDKPSATNLELSWFLNDKRQLSFRYETSSEFAENPERRYGASLNWLISDHAQFSVEYLRSSYRPNPFPDEEDDEGMLLDDNVIAARLSFQF